MNERPSNVVDVRDVKEEEFGKGRIVTRDADLRCAVSGVNVGLVRMVVPSGMQSAPEHAHMAEEELFYVLKGKGTLLQNGERIPVAEGDVIHAACVEAAGTPRGFELKTVYSLLAFSIQGL